jgi:hypothetical protein
VRRVDRFLAALPWLWFGGCAATVALFVLPLAPDERRLGLAVVCALTIYPCIIGWLGLSGAGLIWGFSLGLLSLRAKRRPIVWPAFGFSLSLFAAGMVFVGCAAWLLAMLLGDAFAWWLHRVSG